MKCTYCKKEIEDWVNQNRDEEGNEYCMDCVSKLEYLAEKMEDYEYDCPHI